VLMLNHEVASIPTKQTVVFPLYATLLRDGLSRSNYRSDRSKDTIFAVTITCAY